MPKIELGQRQFRINQGDDYQVVTFWHWVLEISSLEFSEMLSKTEFKLLKEKDEGLIQLLRF